MVEIKRPKNFMEIVKTRRSFRKYSDAPIENDKLKYLKNVSIECANSFGFKSAFLIFITDEGQRKKLRRAIFSGLMGKVNPWILNSKAPCFVLACGSLDSAKKVDDKLIYLAEAAIVMESLVLAAAEVGLSTCWLGGFGEDGVKKAFSLSEDTRIVAISPLGYPPEKIKVSSWDYMVRNLVSKRRVDIEKIVTILD